MYKIGEKDFLQNVRHAAEAIPNARSTSGDQLLSFWAGSVLERSPAIDQWHGDLTNRKARNEKLLASCMMVLGEVNLNEMLGDKNSFINLLNNLCDQ